MIKKFSKNIFFYALLITFTFSVYSNEELQKTKISPKDAIKRNLDKIINSELKDVFVGIKIENLKTNKVIYQLNQNKLFRPASNQKLITTATAIEYLPENFVFKTQIYINGIIEDTVLNGDLYIKGYGDPLFQLSDLDSILNFLKQKKIKIITGNLIGDVSYFDDIYWGKGWMWDDEPKAFVPYITPIPINSNTIIITVTPANIIGEKAIIKIFPENNFTQIINNTITTSEKETLDIQVSRNKTENIFTLSGKIPINSNAKEYSLSIYRPEEFFIKLFNEYLDKNGIKILGRSYIDTLSRGDLFYEITHKIESVINLINKNSDNLSAENLFKTLSAELLKTKGTNEGSISIIKSFLAKIEIDTNKIVIADGSGVSRYNLVSPEILTKILKHFYQTDSTKFSRLFNSLSMAGVDGTLKNRFKNLKKKILAKTGTQSDATSLTGFYLGKSGNIILFSIIINHYPNNYPNNFNKYKAIEEEILSIIAKYY